VPNNAVPAVLNNVVLEPDVKFVVVAGVLVPAVIAGVLFPYYAMAELPGAAICSHPTHIVVVLYLNFVGQFAGACLVQGLQMQDWFFVYHF